MKIALLLLMVALAGCVGASDDAPRPAPPEQPPEPEPPEPKPPSAPPVVRREPARPDPGPGYVPMLTAFTFEGCIGHEAVLFVPLSTLQTHLPEGYTADVAAGTPLAASGAVGAVQILMLDCGLFGTNVGDFNDTAIGHVAIAIENPGFDVAADEHWYRLRMLAEPGLMADLWATALYPTHVGPMDHALQASAELGQNEPELWRTGFGDYVARGVTSLAFADEAVRVAHYTQVETGRLEWTASYAATTFQGANGDVGLAGDDALATDWPLPGPANQRILHDAAWTDNDLWLAVSV